MRGLLRQIGRNALSRFLRSGIDLTSQFRRAFLCNVAWNAAAALRHGRTQYR